MRRAGLALLLVGCSAGMKQTEADGAFLAEQMRCVDKYDTKPEIDACRDAVRIRWQAPRDAGGDQ